MNQAQFVEVLKKFGLPDHIIANCLNFANFTWSILEYLDPYVDRKKVSLVLVLFSISQRLLAFNSISNSCFHLHGWITCFLADIGKA